MYDQLSADYDRFVDWSGRLAGELPFIERLLQSVGALGVLDAACGTGVHAIALARRGYDVVGADASPGMVERARHNAEAAGAALPLMVAEFGVLARQAGDRFDALLCLGNSLPHALSPSDLRTALIDFAACLRPGGLLMIQNRNFDAVLERRQRWMDPQSHRQGDREWLFLRFYDFHRDDRITFNMVRLYREGGGPWSQQVGSTDLRPLRQEELVGELGPAGFDEIVCWGDMQGHPFDLESSPNLVVTARRAGSRPTGGA